MKYNVITHSLGETQQFAKEFAEKIKPGQIITLSGELGAGKTTFTQGFAQGLGITHRIISPTFVVVRTYDIEFRISNFKFQKLKKFYHIDLYRMGSEKDLESIGLSEILEDTQAITIIEWPERMGSLLPQKLYAISIEVIDEGTRKITVDNRYL